MASKTLAKQWDPQYGWVVADPTQSQGYNVYDQAMSAYKDMYGQDIGDYWKNLIAAQPVQYTDPMQYLTNKQTVTDPLLQWYAASQNQDLLKNESAKAYLDYLAQPLGADFSDKKAMQKAIAAQQEQDYQAAIAAQRAKQGNNGYGGIMGQRQYNGFGGLSANATTGVLGPNWGNALLRAQLPQYDALNKYEFGKPVDQYGYALGDDAVTFNDLQAKYGSKSMAEAAALVSQAGLMRDPKNAIKAVDPLFAEELKQELKQGLIKDGMDKAAIKQAGLTAKQQSKDIWGSLKNLQNLNRTEGMIGAEDYFRRNPFSYSDPTMMQYYEGPNATLVSNEGSPWKAKNKTNLSRLLGGEYFADDVFNYYKGLSGDTITGQSLGITNPSMTGVEGNPYLKQFMSGDQQQYFTPYEYAMHGIYDPTIDRVNIANQNPEYWKDSGVLRNLGNTWGFVTQDNPFANMADSNKVLDREKAKLIYKYDDSGGMFGGGIGGILGGVALSAALNAMFPGFGQGIAGAIAGATGTNFGTQGLGALVFNSGLGDVVSGLSGLNSIANAPGQPKMPPGMSKIRPVFAPNYQGGTPTQVNTQAWRDAVAKAQAKAAKKGQTINVPNLGAADIATPAPTLALGSGLAQVPTAGGSIAAGGNPLTQQQFSNGLSVPQPGDPDYPAYAQALASGREWDYRT